ncbi:MAG: GNAT family N-acetyltransferase [Pyrinomonadaceae bacterium]
MLIEPVILEGAFVRLEPLRVDHLPPLCKVGLDPSIWEWSPTMITNESDLEQYVRDALAEQMLGTALPFATVEIESGTVVGSTRFGNIDPVNKKAEIGWTWIAPAWQRTAVNTEAKLLMLTHAFETWKCIRVELKTDANNSRSRAAITRIGGVEEGTLRNHMVLGSGRYRDTVYFSIIETEWEPTKSRLIEKLAERA